MGLMACISFQLVGQGVSYYHSPSEGQYAVAQRPVKMRILYIAAHPDDENTRLIAHWSQFNGYEVAYLSLTRGEGGQNMLGPELGEALGVIRQEELYAARRLDGATQFFGGAADFGYSKTVDETLEKWDENAVLSRIEEVVQSFKPDVMVTRFPPDARAGHGHHTASAVLAIRAFERLQSMGRRGGYAPKALYWNTSSWWAQNLDDSSTSDSLIRLNIGGFIPELGQSSLEIGTLARGMHKSQGFAGMTDRGGRTEYLQLLKGEPVDWTVPTFSTPNPPMPCPGIFAEWTAESAYWVDSLASKITLINESAYAYHIRSEGLLDTLVAPMQSVSVPVTLRSKDSLHRMPSIELTLSRQEAGEAKVIVLQPEYVSADRVKGEIRQPVQWMPEYSVGYDVPCVVLTQRASKKIDLQLYRWGTQGEVSVALDAKCEGFEISSIPLVSFSEGQAVAHVTIELTPKSNRYGKSALTLRLRGSEASLFTATHLNYDHIPRQTVWGTGALPIVYENIDLPEGLQVGYIQGAGDDAPQAMAQLGIPVKILDAATLTMADLQGLTSVVLGIRAYNVNQGLAAAASVLDIWVKEGGHLVIQYNTATRDQVTDHMGPVPFKLGRDRVTVEETPAHVLAALHPMMRYPNALSLKDFDGWVQERGLYFASEWDPAFVPLIEWADPGETMKQGAWITAPSGQGQVTYCGLSLFREWRAGVPGAYRILANIVSFKTAADGK